MHIDDYYETMKADELLDRAKTAVLNHRMDMADPGEMFPIIAKRWGDILNIEISSRDVALMMINMKLIRLIFDPHNLDSFVDIAGYAACGAEVGK